uniref:TetR/AcrR family transcriptional regulator n=1 Tax=Nocardia abscessus TaxID=120957 RepID=UPI001E31C79E|nr:TetR/AcrR family transcriptional regulator [Nocardia abscessus]
MNSGRDAVDEKIMDAALDRILQVGIRRSSLDDIAKRSGVNRVTIYRRFAGKENLVDAVLERETQRMLAEVTAIVVTSAEVDVRIEETVLHVLRQTRMHQLVGRLLTVAPEEALTLYTVRGAQMVSLGIRYIAGLLERAQELELIARYDALPVAEMIARLAHSVMLTPTACADFAADDATREFVRAAIVPMVKHGISAGSKESNDEQATSAAPPRRAAQGSRTATLRTAAGTGQAGAGAMARSGRGAAHR